MTVNQSAPETSDSVKPNTAEVPAKALISRAELARRAGVSKPAITQACRARLAAACEGRLVNTLHPDVVAWLALPHPAPRGDQSVGTTRARRLKRLCGIASTLTDDELDELAEVLVRVLQRALGSAHAARARSALAALLQPG